MLGTWRRLARFILLVADVCVLVGAFALCDVLADVLRPALYRALLSGARYDPNPGSIYYVLVLLIPAWPLILSIVGFYRWHWWTPWRLMWRAVLVGVLFGLTFSMLALFTLHYRYPRLHILMVVPTAAGGALAVRLALLAFPSLGRGLGRRYALIVGTGREAAGLEHILSRVRYANYEVVGYLAYQGGTPHRRIDADRVLGGLDDLPRVLNERVVDEVVFAIPIKDIDEIREAIGLCAELGVPTHVMADFLDCGTKPEVVDFHGATMLAYARSTHPPELLAIKRLLDVAIAAVLLVVLSPILLVVALLVKLTSPGPVLFRQQRVGQNGRLFWLHKFRTMYRDADARRQDVAALNELDGPVFKSARDPRVTAVGRWLRRHSLDELPQLINVIRGEMSIVGPRPPLPHEVEQYDRWQRRRLSMKPGITGLWQVSGRTALPFGEWVRLDLRYIDNWTLGLDLRIMFKTFWVMLAGTGV